MNQQKSHLHDSIQRIFLFLLVTIASLNTQAQKVNFNGEVAPVAVGTVTVNAGIGVGAAYDGANGGFGFKLAAEYGLWQVGPGIITLGPEIGMSFSGNYHHQFYDDYRGHTFIVAARSAYHYGWGIQGLDTYGGFAFGPGFHYSKSKSTGAKDNTTFPVFGAFVGASYFINPQIGFNAEMGYDITNFQVGVILKLQ